MKVTIIGSGYVGLVSGACFADNGNSVTCLDIDKDKVARLNKGQIPIYEPGLEKLIKNNVAQERLIFTSDKEKAISASSILFICVGTPQSYDGEADLQYVLQVASDIGQLMTEPKVVVTKSTVPVGTADKVRKTIAAELEKRGLNIHFDVASNPEFLKEGAAVQDFLRPDRIVIGANSDFAKDELVRLYAPFVKNGYRVVEMDVASSEMTKYASNAMLATKISVMNEVANLCDVLGADVEMVRQGMGADKRIGYAFTHPGIGYGGSCFPKDVRALIRTGEKADAKMRILSAVDDLNSFQRKHFIDKIFSFYKGDIKGKTFALWGLSFKPETDDIREAPSLDIIKALSDKGAKVRAFDPIAIDNVKKHFAGKLADLSFHNNAFEALEGADAMVLVTEWKPFKSPDFEKMKATLKDKAIFDGRNQYDPKMLRDMGFHYVAVGR